MSDPSKLDDLLVRLDADLFYQFTERAGIMEYDGGVDRDEAELLALVDLLRSHPGALLGLRFLRFELAGRSGGAGFLAVFDPQERHTVRAATDSRILLVLAPWPGDGHPGARD